MHLNRSVFCGTYTLQATVRYNLSALLRSSSTSPFPDFLISRADISKVWQLHHRLTLFIPYNSYIFQSLKVSTLVAPGPIDNSDFSCIHGALLPHVQRNSVTQLGDLAVAISAELYYVVQARFGATRLRNLTLLPFLFVASSLFPLHLSYVHHWD